MFDIYKYGEMLARSLKAINHADQKCKFYRATAQTELQELEANISNASGTILIAINERIVPFDYNSSDSLIKKPIYSLVFAQQTKATDTSTIFKAQEDCEALAMQAMAKMLQDAHAYRDGCEYILPESFFIEGFGPIADLFYGVIMSFTFARGVNYELKPQYWE